MEGVEWVERRKGHENGRRPFPSLPFPRKKSSATTFPQTNTLYILQGKKREKKRQTGDAKARVKRTESVQPTRVCHRVSTSTGGEGLGRTCSGEGP